MSPEEFQNRKLFDNPSLQPQALFRLVGILTALGYSEEECADAEFVLDPETWVGQVVDVDVEEEDYQGRSQGRIQAYHAVGTD